MTANGHTAKRRKLSHTSDEDEDPESQADVIGEGAQQDGFVDAAEEDIEVKPISSRQTSKEASRQNTSRPHAALATTSFAAPSSTAFTLQTADLLRDVKPDHALRLKKLRPHIDRIVKAIESTPSQQPMSLSQAQNFIKQKLQVAIPWGHQPDSDIKYSLSFVKPYKITTQGSLVHHLSLRGSAVVMIVPDMPDELFQEKDYLNYRAIHKRAFYLACIASALKIELSNNYDIQYGYHEENDLMPIVALRPKNDDAATFNALFLINPSLPNSLGPIEKMLPGQKCLRKETITPKLGSNVPNHDSVYNSTIRALCSITVFSGLLDIAAKKAENFQDACLLGAIWLQQRGFDGSRSMGGFGVQEWSIVCALLLESGGHQGRSLFSPRYSAVQLFKAMLQVLGGRDMLDPFVVRGKYQLEKSDQPILLDGATGVNVLFKMTPWSYARLKSAAATSLTTVNSRKTSGFEPTFVSKVSDPIFQYDEMYEIPLRSSSSHVVQEQLYNVLTRGLHDRVSLVDVKSCSHGLWKLSSSSPPNEKLTITIGLLTNPEAAARFVDHGPSVEEKELSKDFRDFWGDKAELRRFKDGRINESLVWSTDTPVTQQIINFICSKHFKLQASSIRTPPILENLQLPNNLSIVPEEVFTAVNTKFQSLASTLHHLTDLPLPIRSVTPAGPALRSTSLILPLEPRGASQPIPIIIQFDTSGRWPDSLPAIQYTKIAFLTKLSDLLTSQNRTLTTRLGLENTSTSHLGIHNTSFLDISYPATNPTIPPTTFRLRIHHDRDLHLIQQSLTSKTEPLSPQLREAYQSALITHRRTFLASPTHTTAIRTLITLFPPLSATIRLLKRWLSAHHLSNHIPESVLEILAAHIFLSPIPWTTPGTATTAFARCLHFLSRWDWTREPLLVDLSPGQDMSAEDRVELGTRFAAWRKMDPNMNSVAWFVGTNIDTTGVVWTQSEEREPTPPRVIAGRVTALAGAAVKVMKYEDESENVSRTIMTKDAWDSVFTSFIADFDFVIHLTANTTGKAGAKGKKKQQYKNLELATALEIDTTGIDIIESYLEDLEQCFGNAAIFFYGGKHSGSSVIGGLWRPHLTGEKTWKIRLGFSTVPVVAQNTGNEDEDAKCEANFAGMLAEMGMMGEGIVEKISTKESM
ncbi:U3 snoRNP protein [Neophaeococcomyces mojaviensis]|uniref:U3 snoRNP protein n=1 Tax=Neophaeococcomyces mojaviensis TaxID=3383035 RepID=A0ACC3A586_9EURO|nr:U3 snoRNP protein [Knufia sp. JES_112]